MLIWLASYPRSGNTFFRILLHQVYGVPCSTTSQGRDLVETGAVPPGEPRKRGPLRDRFALPLPPPGTWEELDAAAEVYFIKTHNLPGRDGLPAVYLVRDGRDALVSYAHFTRAYEGETPRPYRDTLANLIWEERSPYGTWASNVDAWTARPRTVVVSFEELIRRPLDSVRRAVEQLSLPLKTSGREPPSFAELHACLPAFFRRGQVGGWRDEFPEDLLDVFWQRFGATMSRLGYGRSASVAA